MTDEKKLVAYVVQRQVEVYKPDDSDSPVDGSVECGWVDVATVTVEPRTKRSTVIKRALAVAGIEPGGEKPRLRALDAESAEVHEPEGYQPPMEWRL